MGSVSKQIMLTPELQNYIKQQKLAGVSDLQIRQALATQGWTQSDLDQAFDSSSVPISVISSASKIGMATKVLLISIGGIVIISSAAFGYFKYKNKIEPTPASQINNPISDSISVLTLEQIINLRVSSNNPTGDYFIASQEEQKNIVNAFVADNSRLDPTYLYIAANTAYRIGKIKEAAFLFYAAQIRKHFDQKRFNLGVADGDNIQTYWGFLNQTTGQLVNPAIVKDPKMFAEVVEMINKWQVIPTDDALYSKKDYGEYVLAKDKWPALAVELKQDFQVNFVDVINASFTKITNNSITTTEQKVCGDFPNDSESKNYLIGIQQLSKIDSSRVVNTVLIYPKAIKIAQIGSGTKTGQVLACARSTDIATIKEYYSIIPGYQTVSAPSPFLNSNTNLGGLKAMAAADNTKGVVYFYDAGSGDILLFYSHH